MHRVRISAKDLVPDDPHDRDEQLPSLCLRKLVDVVVDTALDKHWRQEITGDLFPTIELPCFPFGAVTFFWIVDNVT